MDNEADLLRRAQERDHAALAEIYVRFAARMFNYIHASTRDRELAKDLTAEVFLRMLEALDSSHFAHNSLSAWLYRIAQNLVIDHRRKRRLPTIPLESTTSPSDTTPAGELEENYLREQILQALSRLPPNQQQVIVLRFEQRMKGQEIAQIMGKSEDAIWALQRRALISLGQILEEKLS